MNWTANNWSTGFFHLKRGVLIKHKIADTDILQSTSELAPKNPEAFPEERSIPRKRTRLLLQILQVKTKANSPSSSLSHNCMYITLSLYISTLSGMWVNTILRISIKTGPLPANKKKQHKRSQDADWMLCMSRLFCSLERSSRLQWKTLVLTTSQLSLSPKKRYTFLMEDCQFQRGFWASNTFSEGRGSLLYQKQPCPCAFQHRGWSTSWGGKLNRAYHSILNPNISCSTEKIQNLQ